MNRKTVRNQLALIGLAALPTFSALSVGPAERRVHAQGDCVDQSNLEVVTPTATLETTPVDLSDNEFFQTLIEVVNFLSVGVAVVAAIGVAFAGIQYVTSRSNPAGTQAAVQRLMHVGMAVGMYVFGWSFLNWAIPGGVLNTSPSAITPTEEVAVVEPVVTRQACELARYFDAEGNPSTVPVYFQEESPISQFNNGGAGNADGSRTVVIGDPVVAPNRFAETGHTPELLMFAAHGATNADIINFANGIASVQGFFTFTHMGVNADSWDGLPPHKFPSTSFNNAVNGWNIRRAEVTLQPYTWSVTEMGSGSDLPAGPKAWLVGFFSEMDAWLSANPNVRITIRLMHEMNGSWVSGANGVSNTDWYIGEGTPPPKADEYVNAWRLIYSLGESSMTNSPRVDWLWGPNSFARGSTFSPVDATLAYPGDNYVDMTGVSWYPRATDNVPVYGSSGVSLESLYRTMKSIAPNKPFGLAEFGVGQIPDRSQFWTDFFRFADENDVEYINYFYTVDKQGEDDWTMLFSPQSEIESFKQGYSRWVNDTSIN